MGDPRACIQAFVLPFVSRGPGPSREAAVGGSHRPRRPFHGGKTPQRSPTPLDPPHRTGPYLEDEQRPGHAASPL